MKKIESCEMREMIHVPFDGFCSESGVLMSTEIEYFVSRFLKDHKKRFYAPYSSVMVSTETGLEYELHYGRLVVPRGESFPSIRDLMQIGSDHWSNRTKENLKASYKQIVADKVPPSMNPNVRNRLLKIDSSAAKTFMMKSTTRPSPLRNMMVKLICGFGPPDGIVSEATLIRYLESNVNEFPTKQPIAHVFNYYRGELIRGGVIRVVEAG